MVRNRKTAKSKRARGPANCRQSSSSSSPQNSKIRPTVAQQNNLTNQENHDTCLLFLDPPTPDLPSRRRERANLSRASTIERAKILGPLRTFQLK